MKIQNLRDTPNGAHSGVRDNAAVSQFPIALLLAPASRSAPALWRSSSLPVHLLQCQKTPANLILPTGTRQSAVNFSPRQSAHIANSHPLSPTCVALSSTNLWRRGWGEEVLTLIPKSFISNFQKISAVVAQIFQSAVSRISNPPASNNSTRATPTQQWPFPSSARKSYIVHRKCETPGTFHPRFTIFHHLFHLPTSCSSRPSKGVPPCSAIFRHRFLLCRLWPLAPWTLDCFPSGASNWPDFHP